jgi:hypothetical protein
MPVGLRDQRARVYAFDEASAEAGGDGYPLPQYQVLASPDADMAWWARVEEPGGREITVGDAAQRESPAVIAFSDEVLVPLASVIVLLAPDGSAGPLYRTKSVNLRRLLQEVAVEAVFADLALYTLVD